jgi:hypothetical protein
MRKLDMRTAAAVMAILVVGLFLLMLVLPGLGGDSLRLLGLLFMLIPVAVVAWLLVYMFGKNPKRLQTVELSKRLARILAGMAATGITSSVFITWLSTKFSPFMTGTPKFFLENVGVALLFVAFASVLLLLSGQHGTYFPFWSKDDKRNADERQKAVRNRVYEKSYRVIIVLLVVALGLHSIPSQRLHDELFQAMALCVFGVPAVIAAWQKDS